MRIIITERQYSKLIIINEQDELEVEETPTKYTYLSVKPWEKGTTKKYFFNKVRPVNDFDPIPNKIKLVGSSGDFIFDEDKLRYNSERETISVDQSELEKEYNIKSEDNEPKNVGINSSNIKKSLMEAFPDYWKPEDSIFSAGLRGIYTIGEKINDPSEDWSIMNYFDTKQEIHDLLYLKYREDESNEEIVQFMVNVFKNDKEFTQLLVNRQWQSIENGVLLEKNLSNILLNKLKNVSITMYPYGSKMDRFNGVDMTINTTNCQVKPLVSYLEKDGQYIIKTYGMRDYTSKKMVNKIIFANDKEILVFNNENYTVDSKYQATFLNKPKILR